jgi:hypothetical protein
VAARPAVAERVGLPDSDEHASAVAAVAIQGRKRRERAASEGVARRPA